MARWYRGGPELDGEIRSKFGVHIRDAMNDDAAGLSTQGLRGDMALIILLDQMSRNVFRGSEKAFDGDAAALALSKKWLESKERYAEVRRELGIAAWPVWTRASVLAKT
jgi:uncharacterized protein (DUF924 family)